MAESSAGTIWVDVKPRIEDDAIREAIRQIVREELNREEKDED